MPQGSSVLFVRVPRSPGTPTPSALGRQHTLDFPPRITTPQPPTVDSAGTSPNFTASALLTSYVASHPINVQNLVWMHLNQVELSTRTFLSCQGENGHVTTHT